MTYANEWGRWHAARTEALSAPYGPLAALCVTHVRDSIARSHDQVVPLDQSADAVPHADWRLRLSRARLQVSDPAAGLSQHQQVLVDSEGIGALAAIEDRLSGLHLGGLEYFEPHHDWVVPATVRDLAEHEVVRTEAPRSDDRPARALVLDAAVSFEIDGRPYALAASREPRGALHVVFSDLTRGHGFPVRHVHVPAPDAHGDTYVDLNRAVLPIAMMTTRFPVSAAPPGNHLDLAVTAGEHRLYLDDLDEFSTSA